MSNDSRFVNALRWVYDRLEGAPEYQLTPAEQATTRREIGHVLEGKSSRAGDYEPGEYDESRRLMPEFEIHKSDTVDRVCFYEQDFYVLSNFSSFRVRVFGHGGGQG